MSEFGIFVGLVFSVDSWSSDLRFAFAVVLVVWFSRACSMKLLTDKVGVTGELLFGFPNDIGLLVEVCLCL